MLTHEDLSAISELMDQKFQANEEKMDGKFQEIREEMNERFRMQDEKFESRFIRIENKLDNLSESMDEIRTTVNVMAEWMDRASRKIKVSFR